MLVAFKLAVYGDWQDWLIGLGTLGRFSHCELVMPDGMCFSALPGVGVRIAKVDLTTPAWRVLDIPGRWTDSMVRWAQSKVGEDYDLLGAILCPWHIIPTSVGWRWYCSEIVAATIASSPDWTRPLDPYQSPTGLYNCLLPYARRQFRRGEMVKAY
jgi:hypothetical protein